MWGAEGPSEVAVLVPSGASASGEDPGGQSRLLSGSGGNSQQGDPLVPLSAPATCLQKSLSVISTVLWSSYPSAHFADNEMTSSGGQVTAQGPKATQR